MYMPENVTSAATPEIQETVERYRKGSITRRDLLR